MASGHTTKRTLTPYRAALLRRMPLHGMALDAAERKQGNDMMGFGWVVRSPLLVTFTYTVTDAGRAELARVAA